MKIALIGATGYVGSNLLTEALQRGHEVTAIARHASTLRARVGLNPLALDITHSESLVAALLPHDVVVVAVKCLGLNQAQLVEAIQRSSTPRTVLIGGAGSLHLPSGTDLVDSEQMPQQYRQEAMATREWLRLWRQQTDINWTFISPSALLIPGQRTGQFRIGRDQLLFDANGKSSISVEDFATAVINELEVPQHVQQRFTVGY